MDEIDKKKLKDLIHRIGLKYNLSDKDIRELVESPFEFTYSKLSEIDYGDVKSLEDFEKKKTNFVYMGLGKLYINKENIMKRVKEGKINLKRKK